MVEEKIRELAQGLHDDLEKARSSEAWLLDVTRELRVYEAELPKEQSPFSGKNDDQRDIMRAQLYRDDPRYKVLADREYTAREDRDKNKIRAEVARAIIRLYIAMLNGSD